MTWTVGLSSSAVRTLDKIPPRVVPAILEFVYGPLADNPHRVGKALRDDFAGLYSAHRGTYRVLYTIDDALHAVTVVRVAHRGALLDPARVGA